MVIAASKANYEGVKALVELGADLYAEDAYGRNALEFAKYNKNARESLGSKDQDYEKIINFLEPLMNDKSEKIDK